MKRLLVLLIMGFSSLLVLAQKESGIVYSEHDAIGKTRALWAAMIQGDKEKLCSFFADTVMLVQNDKSSTQLKNEMGGFVDFWKRFTKAEIKDNPPAYPDAIDYKPGGLWVQDWILCTGRDTMSGINPNMPCHNLYRFNQEGKISLLIQYYQEEQFNEMFRSQQTRENGKIYKNHPLIVTVRKMINALCDEDIEKYLGYFTKKATFWDNTMKYNDKGMTVEQERAMCKDFLTKYSDIRFEQVGYPDCLYYDEGNSWIVMSWWTIKYKNRDTKEEISAPIMLTHNFNADGKATGEGAFYSPIIMQK